MGCFSFLRADMGTKRANFLSGKDKLKLLIPAEFVGHYGTESFTATYEDYGNITVHKPDGTPVLLDLYGFVAFVNGAAGYRSTDGGWDDTQLQENRKLGIRMACYPKNHRLCKYPLKCVSPSFHGRYEDVDHFSDGDPEQGWSPLYWDRGFGYNGKTTREWFDERCKID